MGPLTLAETEIEAELTIASDVFTARKPGSAYFVQHKADKKGQRISYHYRNLRNQLQR